MIAAVGNAWGFGMAAAAVVAGTAVPMAPAAGTSGMRKGRREKGREQQRLNYSHDGLH